MTIFQQLVSEHPDHFRREVIEHDFEDLAGMSFISFNTPLDVLISRWYPGNRVTSIAGINTEEAIALLLGDSMNSVEDLDHFRVVLGTPAVAASIITTLFPREHVPVRGRAYQVSSERIAEVTRAKLGDHDLGSNPAVVLGYTHAIERLLTARNMVLPGEEMRVVKTADTFILTEQDLRRLIMVDSMRSIFADDRITAAMATLDQDATPAVLGKITGDMFRFFSRSIPDAILRLEQYETVKSVVQYYNLDPKALPRALVAHPAIQELAQLANLLVFGTMNPAQIEPVKVSVAEVREAADMILQVIRSTPSIDIIPLTTFAEYFGEAPATSNDGIRRGTVIYSSKGQTSHMEVADVVPIEGGVRMARVEPIFVKAAAMAQPLTTSLLVPEAMHGLANIVADELALEEMQPNANCVFDPVLLTINVTQVDMIFLAMARASSISLVHIRSGVASAGQVSMLFEVPVAEQWRMHVTAATPSTVFMRQPAQVVLYASHMKNVVARPLPSRPQDLSLEVMRDVIFIGDMEPRLNRHVAESFGLTLPLDEGGGKSTPLRLEINALASLVGYNGKPFDRKTAYYAAVSEPGVDGEVETLLTLALAYAQATASDVLADKAKSWLVVRLAPLLLSPSVRAMANRAVQTAIVEAKVDGRRLTPQLREIFTRAAFGTVLAILNRFGKLEAATVAAITTVIPVNTLSVQAGLTLAQLPELIQAPGMGME